MKNWDVDIVIVSRVNVAVEAETYGEAEKKAREIIENGNFGDDEPEMESVNIEAIFEGHPV